MELDLYMYVAFERYEIEENTQRTVYLNEGHRDDVASTWLAT
jgi:hypothetical protein